MNYRIPRAMCLAANYLVKNDPILVESVCVCTQMCGYEVGGVFDTERLVSHSCGQLYLLCLPLCCVHSHTVYTIHKHVHNCTLWLMIAIFFIFSFHFFCRQCWCNKWSVSFRGLQHFFLLYELKRNFSHCWQWVLHCTIFKQTEYIKLKHQFMFSTTNHLQLLFVLKIINQSVAHFGVTYYLVKIINNKDYRYFLSFSMSGSCQTASYYYKRKLT